jgi:pimeloyl-ACP methyl ester carboxylesterase
MACVLIFVFSLVFAGINVSSAQAAPISPTSVLIIPGWGLGPAPYVLMAATFESEGYDVEVLDLKGEDPTADSQAIADKVGAIRAANPHQKVALVGHSAGGLSARYYLKARGGYSVVDTYVAIGTAQYGAIPKCGPGDLPFVCFDAPLLRDVNAGVDTPGPTRYYSLTVDGDYTDGRLDGEQCRLAPAPALPLIGRTMQHAASPLNPAVTAAVSSALAGRCTGSLVKSEDNSISPESTILGG